MNCMNTMNKQSGFTLIELVIVVVILGFLAVTAIPRFIDLTDQAQQANIEGMAGGFATGVSLARAQWEANSRSQDNADRNVVDYDGTQVLLTTGDSDDGIRAGYIVASTGVVNNGHLLDGNFTVANCLDIWKSILQQPPGLTTSVDDLNGNSGDSFDYLAEQTGDGADTTCIYYLKETLSRDANGDFVSPAASTGVGNNFSYEPATSAVAVTINTTP